MPVKSLHCISKTSTVLCQLYLKMENSNKNKQTPHQTAFVGLKQPYQQVNQKFHSIATSGKSFFFEKNPTRVHGEITRIIKNDNCAMNYPKLSMI